MQKLLGAVLLTGFAFATHAQAQTYGTPITLD